MRRKPKENNFKAVLETIRNLMNTECVVPDWLQDILLGYGDPGAAHYTRYALLRPPRRPVKIYWIGLHIMHPGGQLLFEVDLPTRLILLWALLAGPAWHLDKVEFPVTLLLSTASFSCLSGQSMGDFEPNCPFELFNTPKLILWADWVQSPLHLGTHIYWWSFQNTRYISARRHKPTSLRAFLASNVGNS